MAINKSIQQKLKKAQQKLERATSREDHKKPLSHEEEQYKIDHNQSITDKEEEDKSGE